MENYTMTEQEFEAVKHYAKGLKECFLNKKGYRVGKFTDEVTDAVLDYVISIIDLHLQLEELQIK